MKVVTAEQMRELDRRAVNEAEVPAAVLMENAGRAVFDLIDREYGPLAGRRAAVFCGGGNNGGDGFVILRLLLLAGARVNLFSTVAKLDLTAMKAEAATHFKIVERDARACLEEMPDFEADLSGWNGRFDFAVDALLGTGIKEAPRGRYAQAIRAINALGCDVIAVDIPSGVDADTGATPGAAVQATHTVTFAYPKLGTFLFPGAGCTGRLTASDIGFPWSSLQSDSRVSVLGCGVGRSTAGIDCSVSLREPIGWESLVRKRPPESNKGDYGHVGVIAGSRGMVGAPALVARAAQRAGAGLVTVLTAQSAQSILAGKLDEQMTIPLPEIEGSLGEAAWDAIAAFAMKATVLCLGPGLTTHPETVRIVRRIVSEIDRPLVLDADGLNALALNPDAAQERHRSLRCPLLVTPHPGEAARMLGTTIIQIQSDRLAAVRELARRYHAVAVLKGRHTLIADPDGAVCINTSGNPGMATGGMGDTLTGVIGALLAQGRAASADEKDGPVTPLYAAALGVHVHGIAGDIVASERGEIGLTAGDVIDRLAAAFASLTLDA